MSNEINNQKELWNTIINSFSVDVLNGGDVIPESNEYYVCSLLYAYMEDIYSNIRSALKEENIDTACCENLYKIGARRGFTRKGRTLPTAIIKITGKCGALIPNNLEFNFKGIILKTIFTFKSEIDHQSHLDVNGTTYVIAQIDDYTQKAINISDNAKGVLTKEYKNINKEVNLIGAVCPGEEEETCEEYRRRLLQSQTYQNDSKIDIVKRFAYDFPCLTDIKFIEDVNCCPVYNKNVKIDPNCVYVLPVFANSFAIGDIPDVILKLFQAWLFGSPAGYGLGRLPINICGEVLQLQAQYFKIDIVLRHDSFYSSEIKQIEDAIKNYIDSLNNGGLVNKAQIQEIIESVVHKNVDLCIEFLAIENKTPDGLIFSDDKNTIRTFCDMKLVCESVTFYNSEGNIL